MNTVGALSVENEVIPFVANKFGAIVAQHKRHSKNHAIRGRPLSFPKRRHGPVGHTAPS